MKNIFSYLLIIFISVPFFACEQIDQKSQELASTTPVQFASHDSSPSTAEKDFNTYWYEGKAEISSYKLEQARYGEIHEGHAVLVYVTEDFSKAKQVKLDDAEAAGADRVPVLKLNFSKKFNTGIYPYSIMQSIFTPVSLDKYPYSLKTTMSAQEWCGHVFTQLNSRKNHYDVSSFSYFESDGDSKTQLKKAILEDELWTRIRINPRTLPVGKVELIPSVSYSRLRHKALEPQKAEISLTEQGENRVYSISYPAQKRNLTIVFNGSSPYKILSWEESYSSGWGPNAQELTSKGTLMESIKDDYWSHNSNSNLPLRDKLNLPN